MTKNEAIEIIKSELPACGDPARCKEDKGTIMCCLDRSCKWVDAIEVLDKRGEWIEQMLSTECSACHKRFEYLPDDYRNFCPNCGADMKEGEEK